MTYAQTLFGELVRAEIDLWAALERRLVAATELTLGRDEVMRVITTYQQQCRVVDISTDLGITVGAASKLVDRLERAGLSGRIANPEDRRSSLVRLSEAGRRLQRSAAAVVAHALQVLLAPVRNDAPVLVASLQSLRRHLRQLDKEEPSP